MIFSKQIETTDDKTLEFGNIDREELPAIQGYIRGYLEVRRKKQQEKKSANGLHGQNIPAPDHGDEDDDDDDDDDYDPNKSDDDDFQSSDSSDSDNSSSQKINSANPSAKKRHLKEKKSIQNKAPRVESV
jgi:hypothetical protein